jgi:glutaconate CoA-transferase, subunit B
MNANRAELLAATLAGLYAGARTVFVGANSPVPAAAALLARARDPALTILIHGHAGHALFTNGGAEQFDFVAEGRLDVFVLGALQIDGSANLNLVAIGDYAKPRLRFTGSFGSPFVYFLVPRVILFREEHTPRVLVPRVDFVSAPGTSPPGVYRPGGPTHLLTGKALFAFDRAAARFRLTHVHPGETTEGVCAATGFAFEVDPAIAETPRPDAEALALLRGPIAEELAPAYPKFVRTMLRAAHA